MGFAGILKNNKVKKTLFPTIRLLVQNWWGDYKHSYASYKSFEIGLDRGSDRKRYDPI